MSTLSRLCLCGSFDKVLEIEGRGAHRIKKYFISSELGVLTTTANLNLGSVDTGAVGAVREEKKQDFEQNQDSGPSYS